MTSGEPKRRVRGFSGKGHAHEQQKKRRNTIPDKLTPTSEHKTRYQDISDKLTPTSEQKTRDQDIPDKLKLQASTKHATKTFLTFSLFADTKTEQIKQSKLRFSFKVSKNVEI